MGKEFSTNLDITSWFEKAYPFQTSHHVYGRMYIRLGRCTDRTQTVVYEQTVFSGGLVPYAAVMVIFNVPPNSNNNLLVHM